MKYIGLELENFDKAHIWRRYIFILIRKYFKDGFLEVGAGIGSFTKIYLNKFKDKKIIYLLFFVKILFLLFLFLL